MRRRKGQLKRMTNGLLQGVSCLNFVKLYLLRFFIYIFFSHSVCSYLPPLGIVLIEKRKKKGGGGVEGFYVSAGSE